MRQHQTLNRKWTSCVWGTMKSQYGRYALGRDWPEKWAGPKNWMGYDCGVTFGDLGENEKWLDPRRNDWESKPWELGKSEGSNFYLKSAFLVCMDSAGSLWVISWLYFFSFCLCGFSPVPHLFLSAPQSHLYLLSPIMTPPGRLPMWAVFPWLIFQSQLLCLLLTTQSYPVLTINPSC